MINPQCLELPKSITNIHGSKDDRANKVRLYEVRLMLNITKTYLYNIDPLEPHFYIVKLGFTGVYIIFLTSSQKHRLCSLFFLFLLKSIDCGYSSEPPRPGGSNEYPQSMFCAEIRKNIGIFIWKFSVFGGEIFYIFE